MTQAYRPAAAWFKRASGLPACHMLNCNAYYGNIGQQHHPSNAHSQSEILPW
jgi:hypothetical protein